MHNYSLANIAHQALFYASVLFLLYAVLYTPLLVLGMYVYAGIVGTIVISSYYHRCLAHGAWTCPRWLESALLLLGAGHGFMPALSWVNVHMRHHRFSDTFRDPHGPSKTWIQNFNLALHPVEKRYVSRRLLNNNRVMFQIKHYWKILLVYFLIWSVCFGPLSWFLINAIAYLALVAVNMIGHWNKTPTNLPLPFTIILLLAFNLAGETYHKNHHNFPGNAKFGNLDPGWWFILLVEKMQKS